MISLPFSPKARDGDFNFYSTIDSVFPNPFTSANDLVPSNRLEELTEFALYPSYWSYSHHVASLLEEGRISKFPVEVLKIFNDTNQHNMFTLAIKRKNAKIILELMKCLSHMAQVLLDSYSGIIPLKDLIAQNNAYIELLIKNAMVPAISDRGNSPPVVFRQAENKISYALSPQNRYDEEVH